MDSTPTSWCVVWVRRFMHGRYGDGDDLLPAPHPPLLFPDFPSCSPYFCLSQTFSVRLSSHGTLAFCICVGFFLSCIPDSSSQVDLPLRSSLSVNVSTIVMNTETEVLNLTKPVTSRMNPKHDGNFLVHVKLIFSAQLKFF